MPRKKHHHIEVQQDETQDGQPRRLHYVVFRAWKSVRRRFPYGDNLRFTLKERDRRLGQNAQNFDCDREQQEHARKHLTFAEWAQTWLTPCQQTQHQERPLFRTIAHRLLRRRSARRHYNKSRSRIQTLARTAGHTSQTAPLPSQRSTANWRGCHEKEQRS